MVKNLTIPFCTAAFLLAETVNAQFGYGWAGGSSSNDNGCPPWSSNCDGSDSSNGGGSGSSSSSNGLAQGAIFSDPAQLSKATRILIAHAVLASLVWVLFIPSLAILLRLDLKNPIVVKIHAVGQVLSYAIYAVAAGMGVWLARQTAAYGVWDDPHPKLGLAILALALFQSVFGAVHHSIYKKRGPNLQDGKITKRPCGTSLGRVHLWLGRLLIVLGMVNGGLGIRLASFGPFQTDSTSMKAKIAYGTVAATMFLLYLFFVIAFEIKKVRNRVEEAGRGENIASNKDGLPSYDESEESFRGRSRPGRTV